MKSILLTSVSVLILGLSGCGNPIINAGNKINREAEAKGSPFRWEMTDLGRGSTAMRRVMIDLPIGHTSAGDILKKDILTQIGKVEASYQRGTPELKEVRLLPDGREVWILKNQDSGLAYVLSLKPAVNGGTVYSVDGPFFFGQ